MYIVYTLYKYNINGNFKVPADAMNAVISKSISYYFRNLLFGKFNILDI